MAIPLAYNLRNLAVRKGTTLMTALGVALTVAVLLTTMALIEGLDNMFAESGNPLQVLVMRKGSTSELTSSVRANPIRTSNSNPASPALPKANRSFHSNWSP